MSKRAWLICVVPWCFRVIMMYDGTMWQGIVCVQEPVSCVRGRGGE